MLIRTVLCLSAGVGIGELYGRTVRPGAPAAAQLAGDVERPIKAVTGSMNKTGICLTKAGATPGA